MPDWRRRTALDGGFDQRLAGGNPADDAPDPLAAFHLQAVWAIIPIPCRIQKRVQIGAKIFA